MNEVEDPTPTTALLSKDAKCIIREEQLQDIASIAFVTTAAFKDHPYSIENEAAILDRLREKNHLTLSLVAVQRDKVIGHIAFSLVTINGSHQAWHGLGPLSVSPARQSQGIGTALVRKGIDHMKLVGAEGCVLVGAPAFYQRFGFERYPGLTFDGAPPEHFMALQLAGESVPAGKVEFHESFSAS